MPTTGRISGRGVLVASPVYADEALTVIHDIGAKWQTAWNNGDAGKTAGVYLPDAVFSSGVLGRLKGRAEIEKAVTDQMKQTPKLTINPGAARQNGNVI